MSEPAESGLAVALVTVTPFAQNCAILFDRAGKHGAVIDPGGDVDRVLARVADLGVTVDMIVLTHGHIDHAGGAAELRERLPALPDGTKPPIIGPDRRDEFLLSALADQGRLFGIDGARPVTPDRWLVEGDVLSIAGVEFAVLHCPGHTPGHVVLVAVRHRFAVLGDVLFRGSVGRTDFPYGDGAALIGAIRAKLLPLDDEVTFICGHGPGSTIGAERRSNPFLRGGA